MSHTPPVPLPPAPDTPVDERPPYADPRPASWVLVGVVLAVLLTLAVVVAAVRRLRRRMRRRAAHEVIMFSDYSTPYAGATYRCEFYDGAYRQLDDVDLSIVLPMLHGPQADSALDHLARSCVIEVESRDSQRCFAPRLVVFADGVKVRTWAVRL